MKIYIAHSSAYDFKKELYEPLQKEADKIAHTLILPHIGEPINSRDILRECDLVIAEVSYPSTGLGIELGWANTFNIPIICIHRAGIKPSSALNFICKTFTSYSSPSELASRIQDMIVTKSA